MGYRGADVFTIDSSVVNTQGEFILHYFDENLGKGYILTTENMPYMVALEKDKMQLSSGLQRFQFWIVGWIVIVLDNYNLPI